MLGDTLVNPPRKIAIRIARAENLEILPKDGKKKSCTKFRASVVGGKKKESSDYVNDPQGKPTWNFSCMVKLHRDQQDPLCLVVEDSDGRHKGQIVVSIVQIRPRPYTFSADQDPATSNNLLCNQLEPTAKCSQAQGYLLYWIWIEDNFTDDQMRGSTASSINKSMHSLFSGSKSRLSVSKSQMSASNADSMNQLGSIKNLNKPVKHSKTPSFLKLKMGKKHKDKSGSDFTQNQKPRTGHDSDSDIDITSNYSVDPSNPYTQPTKASSSKRSSISAGSYGSSIFMNTSQANTLDSHSMGDSGYQPPQFSKGPAPPPPADPTLMEDPRLSAAHTGSFSNQSDRSSGINYKKVQSGMDFIIPSDAPSFTPHSAVVSTHPELAVTPSRDVSFVQPQTLLNKSATLGAPVSGGHSGSSSYTEPMLIAPSRPEPYLSDSSPRSNTDYNHLSQPPALAPAMSARHEQKFSDSGSFYNFGKPHAPVPPRQNDFNQSSNDIVEMLKLENVDLKRTNTTLQLQIGTVNGELSEVKDKLFKLRMRLLEEGETRFLETL